MGHDEDTRNLDQDHSTGDRFSLYRRQCRTLGQPEPTWAEWLAAKQPLYDDVEPA